MGLHVDWVVNHWAAAFQRRTGRVAAEGMPDHLAESMLRLLHERFAGSYAFVTEPHTDEDCPFREADDLPMVHVPPPGRVE
jgi:hypothetical protein